MAFNRMFCLLMIAALAALPASAAWAGRDSCYSLSEAEAEQGIRIHSELMVIGLNCQHIYKSNGRNLYRTYQEFTSDHQDLFARYEEILINYFRNREGLKNPVGELNSMRTQLANKISNDAARMRPDIFCARYSPRITRASSFTRDQLRQWAATYFPSHPVSRPLCHKIW